MASPYLHRAKMSDCNFGDALGKFLKTGARPDSEARTLGNATVTWNGNFFALTSRKGSVGNHSFPVLLSKIQALAWGTWEAVCLLVVCVCFFLWRVCSFIWTFADSLSFYFRSTRDRHIQTEGMILILRVSPLRVAMRLPVSILIMSSSQACSSKSITIPTYSNSLVKCS